MLSILVRFSRELAVFFLETNMSVITEEAPVETTEVPTNGDVEVLDAGVITEPEAPETTDELATDEPATDEPEAPEDAPEPTDEPASEPVTFDSELPVSELLEQGKPVLDKYELPQDVQAYISTLETKAQVQPLAEFADYGTPEDVAKLLDRQSYLGTSREENGLYRPNTDKFVEELTSSTKPEFLSWLAHDINKVQSVKYPGYTLFQELEIDELGRAGDTPADVLSRFESLKEAVRTNVFPTSDIPDFVPTDIREAYSRMSRQAREEFSLLDPTEDEDKRVIREKLDDLALIQKGIDSDRREAQLDAQQKNQYREALESKADELQNTFFTNFRDQFADDLAKKVQFSTNPKMQKVLAHQHVTLLTQALDDGTAGEFARKTLSEADIPFDYGKAQTLLKEVERASVDLTTHQLAVNEQGQPLNSVELNKAASAFKKAGQQLTQFAQEVMDKQARFTSTGKAEEVKTEAKKIKVAEKARPVARGAAVSTTAKPQSNPHPYGTIKYFEHQADEQLAARRASA